MKCTEVIEQQLKRAQAANAHVRAKDIVGSYGSCRRCRRVGQAQREEDWADQTLVGKVYGLDDRH